MPRTIEITPVRGKGRKAKPARENKLEEWQNPPAKDGFELPLRLRFCEEPFWMGPMRGWFLYVTDTRIGEHGDIAVYSYQRDMTLGYQEFQESIGNG